MYDMIKAQLVASVPFAGLAHIEVVELADGRAITRVGEEAELRNHVGTLHAAALFLAGETASGAATAGAFAEMITQVRPLPRTATITYVKGATSAVTATAKVEEPPADLRERLKRDGKAKFVVAVELADAHGESIATMSIDWHVSQRA
jgi:acyl-coenzyme A thioesterase PaaI-like protein